jgi:hypothetical protein
VDERRASVRDRVPTAPARRIRLLKTREIDWPAAQ